jgi:hypothetical protein
MNDKEEIEEILLHLITSIPNSLVMLCSFCNTNQLKNKYLKAGKLHSNNSLDDNINIINKFIHFLSI